MVLSFKINDCKETNLSNIPVHCIIKNKAVNEISLTTYKIVYELLYN